MVVNIVYLYDIIIIHNKFSSDIVNCLKRMIFEEKDFDVSAYFQRQREAPGHAPSVYKML